MGVGCLGLYYIDVGLEFGLRVVTRAGADQVLIRFWLGFVLAVGVICRGVLRPPGLHKVRVQATIRPPGMQMQLDASTPQPLLPEGRGGARVDGTPWTQLSVPSKYHRWGHMSDRS